MSLPNMVRFELHGVTGGWWEVTAGRSLDDVEFSVHVDGERYAGRHCRVEQLLQLYECAVREIPSSEHPMNPAYTLSREGGTVFFHIDGREVPTSYNQIERTMHPFLSELFVALDEASEESEIRDAVKFLNDHRQLQLNYEELHEELTS